MCLLPFLSFSFFFYFFFFVIFVELKCYCYRFAMDLILYFFFSRLRFCMIPRMNSFENILTPITSGTKDAHTHIRIQSGPFFISFYLSAREKTGHRWSIQRKKELFQIGIENGKSERRSWETMMTAQNTYSQISLS